jgi:hypothetical protein
MMDCLARQQTALPLLLTVFDARIGSAVAALLAS